MRFADRLRRGLVLVGITVPVLLGACRSMRAPPGAISRAVDVPQRTAGMWVEVYQRKADTLRGELVGELVAVHSDSVFVMFRDTLRAAARDDIVQVRLARYRPQQTPLAVWTVLGVLSTASHGVFLVLSAPLWTAVGIGAAVAESRRAIWHISDLTVLHAYARFPQGIPPELNRRQLRSAIR